MGFYSRLGFKLYSGLNRLLNIIDGTDLNADNMTLRVKKKEGRTGEGKDMGEMEKALENKKTYEN